MTISQAIQFLQEMKVKHGDLLVYFDCPYCAKSYAPDKIVTIAAHLTKDIKE